MKDLVIARKYAKSLFAEAQAKNELRHCHQGLEAFVRVAKLRGALQRILSHPFVPVEDKKSLIHAVLGEAATPLLERFLLLLVVRKRLDLIFQIAEAFQEEVDLSQNVQALLVRSAIPMTEAQRKSMQERLEAWLKSKVRMDLQVDAKLIGGVVVQSRDYVVDRSLRGQLDRLRRELVR
jgi:F-type H+-transporting ATPase subunit delta